MNASNILSHITHVKGLEHFDAAVVKAHSNPGQLAKVREGWYLVERAGEMVEIMRRNSFDERGCVGWWDCHQANRRWVGDAMPTLGEIKSSLGIKEMPVSNKGTKHTVKRIPLGNGEFYDDLYEYRGYKISRNDSIPHGYWGHWKVWPKGFTAATRQEVLQWIDEKLAQK